ncbi:ef-hand superfamily Ca2+-modulated protein [Niveomyces insectorum RCEF 264]|uniref:Calmodulin n=1 Tax=Niveomyces insectorum RCEF 264 TaxID=1081102 RepID=A0A167TBX6_9HYPO|nr:ef-hand superfamily Ca2+-modulated protein [Niveomyces insectorum RCEF 264]
MPPKRKAPAAAAGAAPAPKGGPRPSKLAKEHNITAQEEAEIREAFGLFSEPMDGEKEGVLPIGDVRRAMIALGIPPANRAELAEFVGILDPDDEGFAPYPAFVAICALKLHARAQTADAHAHAQEVDEAFRLFAGVPTDQHHHHDDHPTITLAHLKRVAATLKETVAEEVLRDMIREANGGGSVAAGVDRTAFESVMRRAGVWR